MSASDFETLYRDVSEGAARFRVRIPVSLRYLEGHFPGDPLVPGVGQLLLIEERAREAWPSLGPIAGVRRLKFQEALRPGHELDVALARDGAKIKFTIEREGRVCSTGTLVISA